MKKGKILEAASDGTCYCMLTQKSIIKHVQYNICGIQKALTSIPTNITVSALRKARFGLWFDFDSVGEEDGQRNWYPTGRSRVHYRN